jgi:hypothetical protein
MSNYTIDMKHLLKLRLVIARFGEMDIAKWWNTKGQLGRLGTATLHRGFPRTHSFAQARSVFAIAEHRCKEVFAPTDCVTLWLLSEAIEEEFDTCWEYWLDHTNEWQPFFRKLESLQGSDLVTILKDFELVTSCDVEMLLGLKCSAEGRAVLVPGMFSSSDADIVQLALGFSMGKPGILAVPYMGRQ